MAKDTVRVGFIGAGGLSSSVHYPSLAEMDDVELAAVCELNEERMKKAIDRFGVKKGYSDYREMLEKEKPDAVYVVMPPQHLYALAADILRSGTALFVEKPPGLTSFQTGCLAEIAAQHGAISMVGFNRRYAPLLVEAKRRIEERGGIDHFIFTFSKFGGPGKRPYGDGVIGTLMSDAIHAVDSMRFLGGEVEAMKAVTRLSHRDQDEKFVALMRFDSGASGFLNCCWTSGTRTLSAELHGGSACAYVTVDHEMRVWVEGGEPELITAAELGGGESKHHREGYFQENRHFMNCVKTGEQPQNNLADSYKSMLLAEKLLFENL